MEQRIQKSVIQLMVDLEELTGARPSLILHERVGKRMRISILSQDSREQLVADILGSIERDGTESNSHTGVMVDGSGRQFSLEDYDPFECPKCGGTHAIAKIAPPGTLAQFRCPATTAQKGVLNTENQRTCLPPCLSPG